MTKKRQLFVFAFFSLLLLQHNTLTTAAEVDDAPLSSWEKASRHAIDGAVFFLTRDSESPIQRHSRSRRSKSEIDSLDALFAEKVDYVKQHLEAAKGVMRQSGLNAGFSLEQEKGFEEWIANITYKEVDVWLVLLTGWQHSLETCRQLMASHLPDTEYSFFADKLMGACRVDDPWIIAHQDVFYAGFAMLSDEYLCRFKLPDDPNNKVDVHDRRYIHPLTSHPVIQEIAFTPLRAPQEAPAGEQAKRFRATNTNKDEL